MTTKKQNKKADAKKPYQAPRVAIEKLTLLNTEGSTS